MNGSPPVIHQLLESPMMERKMSVQGDSNADLSTIYVGSGK
jgi:hypothetical protein